MTRRLLSHSEVSAALDCQARHAFAYTGHLTQGTALARKTVAPRLREGRAWGVAMAAWHSDPEHNVERAHAALVKALDDDATEQQTHGVYDPDQHANMRAHLVAVLCRYHREVRPMQIVTPERELLVPIPSRTGRRRSNLYWLQCFIDGVGTDQDGRDWIVEFKLRGQLSSVEQIALGRQTRWYAWAWRETTGRAIAGVVIDERLNAIPRKPRILKNGQVSHAKDQLTTPDLYEQACIETGEEAREETLGALRARRWHQREAVMFRDGELDEVGRQLVSAAHLIRQLDTAELWPVPNPSPLRCPGCPFKDICPTPDDSELVDALYTRKPPKRDRRTEEIPA